MVDEVIRIAAHMGNQEQLDMAQRVKAEILSGFRHLYLFNWLENAGAAGNGAGAAVPEVSVADIWLEDEELGPVDLLRRS